MGKTAKKKPASKKKAKIVAKLIAINGGKSKRDISAQDYLVKTSKAELDKNLDELFEEETAVEAGTTAHPDGSFTNQYSRIPTLEEIKNSFPYQDILKKYRRQQLKANNKRWQYRSVKIKLDRMRQAKEIEAGISFVEKAQLEEIIEFAVKLINRARKKTDQYPVTSKRLKALYHKQSEPWS